MKKRKKKRIGGQREITILRGFFFFATVSAPLQVPQKKGRVFFVTVVTKKSERKGYKTVPLMAILYKSQVEKKNIDILAPILLGWGRAERESL